MPLTSPPSRQSAADSAASHSFRCSWKPDGAGSASIHLSGELDRSSLARFQRALQDAQLDADSVTVDLHQLTFIDCAAFRALFLANAFALREGKRLIVVRGSGQVDRMLEVTGLYAMVEVVGPDSEPGSDQAAGSSRLAASR